MENDPVTVEPVQRLDRQRDISSNHEEIQESRSEAQDTVQFQSADVNHDLEKSLQNLEVVEHVEGETSENNHDQREESQNLHAYENNGQEISAEANHDLENRLQNLEVVEHVERERDNEERDDRNKNRNSTDLEKFLEIESTCYEKIDSTKLERTDRIFKKTMRETNLLTHDNRYCSNVTVRKKITLSLLDK
ncbi:Hypothetical predicted protein [Mytilus galloprovincialis]|uniref:Uncharacterized protein n=1 Tax=Mytilus galloprovincialis TaxID=29158 RepID=A0A8B6BRI5_MYTGA|nr:Hypothetical predicted protein [Mytilus galloprovincialis]